MNVNAKKLNKYLIKINKNHSGSTLFIYVDIYLRASDFKSIDLISRSITVIIKATYPELIARKTTADDPWSFDY